MSNRKKIVRELKSIANALDKRAQPDKSAVPDEAWATKTLWEMWNLIDECFDKLLMHEDTVFDKMWVFQSVIVLNVKKIFGLNLLLQF
jgi:hypothetical protein